MSDRIEAARALADEIATRADELVDTDPIELRELAYKAGSTIRGLIDALERARATTVEVGPIAVTPPSASPADVAAATRSVLERTALAMGAKDPGVTPPPAPRPPRTVSAVDRFFDDANDRRVALQAAARVVGPVSYGNHAPVTAIANDFYSYLRKGKPAP